MINRLLKHCIISSVEMSCVGTFIYLYTTLFIFSWELDIENEGLVLWEKFMYFGLRTHSPDLNDSCTEWVGSCECK